MDGLAAMEKENLSPRISTPSPDEQGWSREHSMSTSDSARGTDLSAITSPDVAPADTVAEISCQAADNDPPPADNSQSAAPAAESDKARLLRLLKRDVKTLMEEATIRHVIHEHSSYVNSLCASIEACLSHGLRKRVFGLFGTGTTFALLHKIAKLCPAAATVLKLVLHMQQNEFKQTRESSENRSSSMGESLRGILPSNFMSGGGQGGVSGSGACSPANDRYMWIRVALAQKLLVNIADFVEKHAHRYYEKEALMADPVHGHMVASLLVAPCALDYTKVKSYDSYLTDPPAGELVQRHRIHSSAQYNRSLSISTDQQQSVDTGLSSAISTPGGSAAIAAAPCGAPVEPAHCATPRGGETTTFSPTRGRPSLQVSRNPSVGANLDELGLSAGAPASGRQCVNSLHQNTRSSLLYGKNNVSVCPVGGRELMRGYLSLHQNSNGTLCIKWTPNELMRGGSEHAVPPSPRAIGHNRSVLWRHALSINVADIIYMHYHSQRADSSGSVVFVGADGVQYPPLHFPAGQHPLQFLSCLENGLLPWGQLDPPLWLHRGKGKILPRLRRRSSVTSLEGSELPGSESTHSISDKADGGTDLVFRIMPIVPLDSCLADRTASSIDQSSRCTSGTAPTESDRSANLIALSNLSSLLKTRFMSVGSSPASSPPSTPRASVISSEGRNKSTDVTTGCTEAQGKRGVSLQNGEPEKSEKRVITHSSSAPVPADDLVMIQTTESLNDDDQSITSPSRQPLAAACNSMRMQILSRAFYGWLAHCRHLRTIRTHLVCLVKADTQVELQSVLGDRPLDSDMWMRLREDRTTDSYTRLCTHVYHHGVSPGLRAAVWPHLLQLVPWDDNVDRILPEAKVRYEASMREWLAVEAIVKQRDDERFAAARERELHERLGKLPVTPDLCERATLSFDEQHVVQQQQQVPGGGLLSAVQTMRPGECSTGRSTPEKSVGGCAYSKELVDTFALHLHRIEKDVSRCDRNHAYFALESNLDKLRNVMCTYVWQNLDLGYVQGMCDLAAPLLVVFDDETLSHGCFSRLMDRMWPNFPHGAGMDARLANTRALVQVAEPELFELMHRNGDYTHFYFAYRWFLLDFKREFAYEDMYTVWEVIWAASTVISDHFSLFLALALLQMYREIILDNNMDFTDIIKFFNEMAERHDAELALRIAREQLKRLCDVVRQDL